MTQQIGTASEIETKIYKLLRQLDAKQRDLINNHTLITNLARILSTDPGIIQVLYELKEIQHFTEKQQFETYKSLQEKIKVERAEFIQNQKEQMMATSGAFRSEKISQQKLELTAIDVQHKREKLKFNEDLYKNIEARVKQQQTLLSSGGLSDFYETNDKEVIELQMAILNMLLLLAPQ